MSDSPPPRFSVRRCPVCSDDPKDERLPKSSWVCSCGMSSKSLAKFHKLPTHKPKVGHRRVALCANCEQEKKCWENDFLCLSCRFETSNPFVNDGHTVTFGMDRGKILIEIHCPEAYRDVPNIDAKCSMRIGGEYAGCLVMEQANWEGLEYYNDPYGSEMPITGDDMAVEWFFEYVDGGLYEDGEEIFYWRLHDPHRSSAFSGEKELAEVPWTR